MKKILLSLGLFSLVLVGKSQTILNELYVQNKPTTNEFFELYYAGTLPIGDNVDCWTLVSYYDLGGTNQGVYVMDLPNVSTGFTNRYMVGAASNPFTAQGSTNKVPNFNWNAMPSSGRLTKWRVLGGAWVQDADPVNLQDFFNNKGGSGFNYSALVFVNGNFNNGFLGGTNQSTSAILTSLPPLDLTTANSNVCSAFTIDWTALGALEHVTEAAGADNGYKRNSDGQCGAWVKSSSTAEHTPGSTNGAATTLGDLTTFELISCGIPSGYSTLNYNVTGISGAVTLADDFPISVQVFKDNAPVGTFDANDVLLGQGSISVINGPNNTLVIPQTANNLQIVYRTKRGCFDKVVSYSQACSPLPVGLLNFSATRNMDAVILRWATAYEQNNTGFDIERNVNGVWEKIGFVSSLAMNGNSSSDLSYSFVDRNNTSKGISQYRLRQVDIDAKATYSDVRAVRGDGQIGKITIYPNPTADGKVNILFDDANVVRTVSISDMSGRMVKEVRAISNNNITIMNLQPGMYTVKITVPETGEQAVQKIVVNKR